MGRPSTLHIEAHKEEGQVTDTWVSGSAVMVTEGFIHV